MRERRRKERGNLKEGEGTLGRGEGNSAGTRSHQKLVQPGDILFDTQSIQFEEGERSMGCEKERCMGHHDWVSKEVNETDELRWIERDTMD